MNKILIVLFLGLFISSCVPNKNIIYLQGEPIAKNKIERLNKIPYKLRVDDILTINIKSVNQELVDMFQKSTVGFGTGRSTIGQGFSSGLGYFSGYSIDNHGNIRLPYIGELNVLGYTVVEVRKKIEEELGKLFKKKEDIFVTVKLAGIRYTIIGEIKQPGVKVIYQNNVNIIEAITNSGDITPLGNRKKVEVIRTLVTGQEKFLIDLTKIDAFNSKIFYIQPNDIINIYPIKQKALGIGTTGLQSLTTIFSVFSILSSIFLLAKNL